MADTISNQIAAIKAQWGSTLVVLGHYYQDDSVLAHADFLGDSLELARRAASAAAAERIVFCGVHFMAESADLLRQPHQTVFMPDVAATCPMAEMATYAEVERAWDDLCRRTGPDWIPVVYVNSTAEIKAFCGARGGSTCTSSNAANVFKWVLSQNKRVLFLPDEHLGVNTAHDLGIPDAHMAVYDPAQPDGGVTDAALADAKIVAWKGYCHVHTFFHRADVHWVRRHEPDAKIIVHPETPCDIVRLADAHGSTSQIIRYVDALPAGSTVYVGTEVHLVDRLAKQQAGRVTVKPLNRSVCPNMARTTDAKLLAVLQQWPVANEVHVPVSLRAPAAEALQRMLSL